VNFGNPAYTVATGNADGKGYGDFEYAPPHAELALGTNNLPAQAGNINDHWRTVLYTGNGVALGSGGNPITGVGFSPNFVWLKSRGTADYHALFDTARGATKYLASHLTQAETTATESLGSFDSDGFTLGSNTTWNNTTSYVAWCASLPNTKTSGWAGSPTITPTKEIYNAKLGMSIVTYTGDGVAGSIPHSQGKAPGMVIVKRLDTAGYSWMVYHSALGVGYYGMLESTAAFTTTGASTVWNSLDPTASLVNIGTSAQVNASGGTYVAYIFAETDFLKVFSCATADGFINLGGKARFVYARHDAANMNHNLWDATRDPANPAVRALQTNVANAENTAGAWEIDILASGIKLRGTNTDLDPPLYGFAIIQPNGPTENTAR